MIDRHNRSRQSTLMIERKVRVTSFEKRINTTIFAMVGPVDAWFLYRGIRRDRKVSCDERHFYERLLEQLIDNKLDCSHASTRAKRRTDAELLLQQDHSDSIPSHLQLVSVTPTK